MPVHGARRSEPNTQKHEAALREFLYDEGPSTTDDLAKVVGVSRARTLEILGGMHASGVVANSYLRGGSKLYWLLAEDA